MARSKQEVRDFLNSLVGLMVNEKCGIYNGQCVSLIKALLEFLGAPNPYAGRGNAITVGDTLLAQGIAKNGKGWLNVCVNRDMGRIFENGIWNNYGHIWIDIDNEMNIEQNGNKALRTTKNTRPIAQAQQIVNLDQYIAEAIDMKFTKEQEQSAALMATGSIPGENYNYPFTVQEVTQASLDAFLQTWLSRSTTISRDMENEVADGISGVKNYIGWDGYNSDFVGRPVVSHYRYMVEFWIKQKPAKQEPGGTYEQIDGPVFRKVK